MADVSVTANSVVKESGTTFTGIAGAAITAGQVVYKDEADAGKIKLADTDSATAAVRQPFGIALNAAQIGQPVVVQITGDITLGAASVTRGMIYVLSGNAGGIAPVADLAAGDYTAILGIGRSATSLRLNIFAPDIVI